MFLLTSFIAALALWSLVRIVMQRAAIALSPIQAPGPDSLYFEMRTGLILAAGAHISQLLGYRRAADCLAQFDGAAHFKNASLVQLISGAVKPEALVLQTAQGQTLPGDLRIRVIEGVEAVEVQAATKVERRARVLTPSDASRPAYRRSRSHWRQDRSFLCSRPPTPGMQLKPIMRCLTERACACNPVQTSIVVWGFR